MTDPASPALTLGDFRITALSDGFFDVPAPFLMRGDAPLPQADDPLHLQINAFLIQGRGQTILVDTGCGAKLGPTVNRTRDDLRRAGVEPSGVDIVLCTHIHPDHTNGLIDAQGAAQFPNARIFVHQRELDFWLSENEMSRAPAALQVQFGWAMEAFAPYRGRVEPFEKGKLLNGIEAVPLYGHTPGHTGFHIDGGGDQQLLIWGDSVHAIERQAAHPEITVAADVDPAAARDTRSALFDHVAADGIRVAGMHLPYPGFGRLVRARERFAYRPDP